MKASELIMQLEGLKRHQGDLEVVVEVTSESQIFALDATVDCDRWNPTGPAYFVLSTEGYEI